MKTIRIILFVAAVLGFNNSFAQCKTFVKNNCREAMGEYIPGEAFNAAKLKAGDQAEVEMTFYADEDYRLLVCNHPVLGQVNFQVLDSDGTVLFDNIENENTDHFDFRVAGTKTFKILLKAPDAEDDALSPQGCVAIMVGRKLAE